MPVTLYRWDDASAPVLNGTAGSMIAVLDACLVNGYGSKAALGWTKEFSGTNAAAYRAAGGTRRWLDVVDTSATNATLRGYGAMTALATGTDPFPTTAQLANGVGFYKSTAGSTERPWVLVGDDRAFYLIGANALTAAEGMQAATNTASLGGLFFGDLVSYLPMDAWSAAIIGSGSTTAATSRLGAVNNSSASVMTGHFMARSYTQTGESTAVGKVASGRSTATMGSAGGPYPSPVHGGIDLSPVYVCEPTTRVTRGHMPGLWSVEHALPGTPMDTFSGKAGTPAASKTFILLPVADTTTAGRCAIEISDTWR